MLPREAEVGCWQIAPQRNGNYPRRYHPDNVRISGLAFSTLTYRMTRMLSRITEMFAREVSSNRALAVMERPCRCQSPGPYF